VSPERAILFYCNWEIGSASQTLADASDAALDMLGGFRDDLAVGEIDLEYTAENNPDDRVSLSAQGCI